MNSLRVAAGCFVLFENTIIGWCWGRVYVWFICLNKVELLYKCDSVLVSSLSLLIASTYLSCILFGELNKQWRKGEYKGIKNTILVDIKYKALDKYDYITKIEKW